METMLSIGAKLDKETAVNASEAIERILKAGFEFRSSDAILLKSLDVLKSAVSVEGATVTHCTFENDSSKTIVLDVPSDFMESK